MSEKSGNLEKKSAKKNREWIKSHLENDFFFTLEILFILVTHHQYFFSGFTFAFCPFRGGPGQTFAKMAKIRERFFSPLFEKRNYNHVHKFVEMTIFLAIF